MSETSTDGQRHQLAVRSQVIGGRQPKTAEIVARKLVEDIVQKGLRAGDSLDAEPAMLERFGVSRESLREALRILEVQGLVTMRRGPGGGAFVGSVNPAQLGTTANLYYHLAGATYDDLFESFMIFDAMLAERAAMHPDAELRRTTMAPYLDDEHDHDDVAAYVRHHSEFHCEVARLAGNRVLEITLQSIGLLVGQHYMAAGDPRRSSPFAAHDHAAIAEAITAGHHRRAHELMLEHDQRVVDAVRAEGLDGNAPIGWV